MSGIVLDASALLAPMFDEPGGGTAAAVLGSGVPLPMSAANLRRPWANSWAPQRNG